MSTTNDSNKGLIFRLSEGTERPDRQQPPSPPAQAARLTEEEAQNVLKRLQPIKTGPDDEQEFALRDRSLPPPRAGKIINAVFPSPDQPPTPGAALNSGPLEVVRRAPEGAVPLAPQLSVTFSQPMVAVTSNDDLAAQSVPVKISPEPPGRWRWVGTKTLLFEPAGRFPMATSYSVEVPAGTRSAAGGALESAVRWSFSTPPPQVKTSYPADGPYGRDPLFFIEFDQRIDPSAVLRTIKLRAGRVAPRLRLATPEEVEADEPVRKLARRAQAGCWLAFRAVGSQGKSSVPPLPGDARVEIVIGPGTPSAEGPRTTDTPQSFAFRTFGPLRVTKSECGWNSQCSPFDAWRIEFSNPLDAAAIQQSQIRIAPEVPGFKTAVYGNTLQIEGVKQGRQIYTVTLDASIRDSFGQTLGSAAQVSFKVGPAPQALAASRQLLVVADPSGPPSFSVYSINYNNLKVSLYAASPEQWNQFVNYARYAQGYTDEAAMKQRTPPGRLVLTKTLAVKSQPDEMAETRIDLGPALEDGFGQVIVVVEPAVWLKTRRDRQIINAWVQVTNIGLAAFVDHTELVGWATRLKDGAPLNDVRLKIYPGNIEGTSGADGIARLPLRSEAGGTSLLIARQGSDTAFLPENISWWYGSSSGWQRRAPADSLRWYVFDDRKMYRPGEEVHIKGWLRRIGGGPEGDVGPLDGAVPSVSYTLRDARGNEVVKGALQLNALGGFDTVLKLPKTMNLGSANLQLEAQGWSTADYSRQFTHSFQVQEFRRPEFEVTAVASEGPHFVKGTAEASVTATYYAGGGLPNAEITWRVTSTPGQFTPPNRGDFTFGKWIPWWIASSGPNETRTEVFAGRTDAAGKHRLHIDFDSANPPRPSNVTARASVTDVNRQTWTATASMLVHPADLYVGLRSRRTFVQKGEPLEIESIVTDLDGTAIANRSIRMRAVRLDWTFENGQWKQQEADPQDCEVKSAADAVKCSFATKEGGQYRVTATILDDRERPNESELTLWVAGGKVIPRRDVEQEKVELIPDRKEYRAGDTAEILVQAPFYPAEGIVSLRRSGIVRTERFRMGGPSYTLRVPIEEKYVPNLHVQVDLVGAAARADDAGRTDDRLPRRPAFAAGSLNLPVPPLARRLIVQATPRAKALEPGGETVVDLEVRDAAGRPVSGGQAAVVVVDESVLALTGYRLSDPLTVFYSQRNADVSDHHLRENVLLSDPDKLSNFVKQGGGGPGGGAGTTMPMATPAPAKAMGLMRISSGVSGRLEASNNLSISEPDEAIRLRENFNALAVFAPSVPTDANGRAQVAVKLPDNLTRYRVMAVSVAGGRQFGAGESAITARLPLMARPSAPRFLNFGDQFELPVVIQNQTDKPMSVDVAVRAVNAELMEGAGRRVMVPANDRVEVRFPTAAKRAGTARFQIGAVSGKWSDAAEIQLPVWTPATSEAFATYGEIDEGSIAQPFKAPTNAVTQFGGLQVTASSTQLQALTDAVLYLVSYPFECSEQLSSRVLAVAALKDVLAAFEAKDMPSPEEMKAAVARDLRRLQGLQNGDGGFGFWRRGDESWPYVSIHVAHALERAQEKKFDVPDGMIERSKNYLRNIESHIPSYYSPEARRALIAYALYVRHRMGDRDAARARRLIAEATLENLSLEAVGWLLPVLSGDPYSRAEVAAIRQHLNNRATETAATAQFNTSYSDGAHLLLHSERRADGIILEALIGDQPTSDLIPKLARGLLAHRRQGRWNNTQENVFILLALDRYFATYEKATPDFVARAWLGDRFAGQHQFKGRTTDYYHVNIPMRLVADQSGQQNLILSKDGPGRLYYRIGMQYAPASLKLAPADYGFTVERVYEPIDDPNDVRREEDGTWQIKAGARVRVRLTLVAPARRYHVALVDPLPAGLEALNPALAVTESIPPDQKTQEPTNRWWYWFRPWFDHQNLRDERVEAFASLLWEGVYTYSYVARATTPGLFIVPPPKAEEMYHPETFGRGGTDRVRIE
jgi:uncharacterized protein YfaS (alpha-2-macroglobulin family)